MARAKAVLESVPASPDRRTPRRRNRRRRVSTPSRQVYERRYVQTIRAVDLWSVLKVAICFYFAALIVLLVSGMMLWWIASAAGAIGNIEKFIGELVDNKDFRLLSWQVLRAATLIGLVMVCILTVLTVLGAAFYNLFSELLGGVEVTVVEQEELDK
jgi:hypothetical protein